MTNPQSPMTNPLLHVWALSTIFVALITLTFGALVTSMNAGMAFPDWPTSDGYLMITYPWLQDFAINWDKFLEHGHRLAGMLIGIWSIALVALTYRLDFRRSVRRLSVAILLGVICQGLLGGFRVQLDERGLAMLHGIFAAIVFSLMGTMALVTGKTWRNLDVNEVQSRLTAVQIAAVLMLVMAIMQYVFGSLIRHKGMGLAEHFWMGVGMPVLSLANLAIVFRSKPGVPWLRRSAVWLAVIVFGQVALGLCAWAMKYGIPSMGIVGIADSVQQVLFRTAHMVWGTVTIMAIVLHGLRVFRVAKLAPAPTQTRLELRQVRSAAAGELTMRTSLPGEGGVA